MAVAKEGADPRKVVIAALLANGGIAIAKFAAAFLSGSVTMLAEAIHSVADTANQALLLVGMGLSRRSDPDRFPLGRHKESYFWAFVVSLMLFLLGGVFAVYEGIHKLYEGGGEPGNPLVPLVVLGVSLVIEGASFVVAIREFRKFKGDRGLREALFRVKDPTIPVVLLEDAGAVLGLAIAFAAITVSYLTGNTLADGVGSLIIGILLCAIGVVLAYDTHGLIIGESAAPETERKAVDIARATDGVEEVTQALTVHLGPKTILLAFKIRFDSALSVRDVERVTDDLEERIRAEIPEMKRIFVEADSDYDASLDPARS